MFVLDDVRGLDAILDRVNSILLSLLCFLLSCFNLILEVLNLGLRLDL